MTRVTPILLSILLASTITFTYSLASQDKNRDDSYAQDACSVTRYHNICIHSLAPFADKAKDNPIIWARVGVSVTIREAKKLSQYLTKLKGNRGNVTKGRNIIALSDCLECFQDTLDNLHKSLGVLRNLSFGEFNSQMEDVTTWVSAALTDEDTCLDGFGEKKGKRIKTLVNRVSNVSYMTSNALALVNKLATTGPGGLTNE
ncbi:hypothetical protein ACJIZ3_011638 [Penstemon smallii]|uniref:Pectinesterase inhibitor domain-containing protein n=1 Tax=Penstemon smallii TaxID=265156 RepID=A0ABD3UJN4_9LAMI